MNIMTTINVGVIIRYIKEISGAEKELPERKRHDNNESQLLPL